MRTNDERHARPCDPSGGGYDANIVTAGSTLPVTVADDETASTEVRLSVIPGARWTSLTGITEGDGDGDASRRCWRLAPTAVTVTVAVLRGTRPSTR